MPWFPDFVNAAELARAQTRAAGRTDPVGRYFAALTEGDLGVLENVWPGEVVVYDPRAGEVRGHRRLREFVLDNRAWLAERQARIETTATTRAGARAVVELTAHLKSAEDGDTVWPIAVVADCPDDRSVIFRTYCSQWPVDGRHHVRPPILTPRDTGPGGVVGRLRDALATGDADAAARTFAPDGYLRGPLGQRWHARDLGGGIGLRDCAVTDDGVRCAVEYTLDRWGGRDLPPQAGVGVFERGPDGLLTAVRIYDDVDR